MIEILHWALISGGFVVTTTLLAGVITVMVYDWWQNR